MSANYNCRDFHDSCIKLLLEKTVIMAKYTIKLYSLYHIVPYFLFKKYKNKELKEIVKELIVKILRSAAYMSGFILILRASLCLISNTIGKYNIILSILQSILCATAVLCDTNDRVKEYTIFTIPKSLESLFDLISKRGVIKEIPCGLSFLFSCSMAILIHLKNEKMIFENFDRILSYFIY
jgi:hypothetical protein